MIGKLFATAFIMKVCLTSIMYFFLSTLVTYLALEQNRQFRSKLTGFYRCAIILHTRNYIITKEISNMQWWKTRFTFYRIFLCKMRFNANLKNLLHYEALTKSDGEPVEELCDGNKTNAKTKSTNPSKVWNEVQPGHLWGSLILWVERYCQ